MVNHLFRSIKLVWSVLDRREQITFFGLAMLASLVAVVELSQVALLVPIMSSLANVDLHAVGPLFSKLLIWLGFDKLRNPAILFLILVAFSLAKFLLLLLFLKVQASFFASSVSRMSRQMYRLYLYAPIAFHIDHNSAQLHRNIRTLGFNAIMLGISGLISVCQGVLTLVLVSGLLVLINPLILVFGLAGAVILIPLQYTRGGETLQRLGQQRLDIMHRVNAFVLATLQAIKEAQLSQAYAYFVSRYEKAATAEWRNTMRTQFLVQIPGATNDLLLTAGIGIVFAILVSLVEPSKILPTLVVLFGAAFRFLPSINRISSGLNGIRSGVPSIESYNFEMDRLKLSLPASDSAPEAPLGFIEEIQFDNVWFQHPSAATPSVSELSFAIRKGEMVGIVGSSGAGKTTVANLLLGLFKPQCGRVLVDGQDISNRLRSWHSALGYVPQQVVVIDDSLRRNVAFGVVDSDIDDERVMEALRQTHLLERFGSTPECLETNLGERGAKLSGGEIQRIGIARVLYRGATILVLDEATSSLDAVTERTITGLIKSLSERMTIIVIAHRLSTLRDAHRIIYLKNGRCAGQGSFSEISLADADFRNLVHSAEFKLTHSA